METLCFDARLPTALLGWYRENARDLPWRHTRDPYAIWLSEIMLQQTQVDTVIPYYHRFLAALPTLQALAAAPEPQVLKLWEGLGYYSRARNLHRCAQAVVAHHGGVFPQDYASVRALPGIGEYTAGAILSIAFEQPEPAVDGNVLRVAARLGDVHADMSGTKAKRRVAQVLRAVYPAQGRGDFTQSLMELGATVCVPGGQPRCGVCPVAGLCLALGRGTAAQLPQMPGKKARRAEALTVFVLQQGGQVALCRRGDDGLLAGMWALPNVPGSLDAEQAARQLAAWGVEAKSIDNAYQRKHIFTHVEWHMTCYRAVCRHQADGFDWAALDAPDSPALPTAFKRCL